MGLAHLLAYSKAIPPSFLYFPFPSFPFRCLFIGLQTAEYFMADFAFPNAIFPVNVNNAPFPGRVPLAFFDKTRWEV